MKALKVGIVRRKLYKKPVVLCLIYWGHGIEFATWTDVEIKVLYA